MGVDGQVQKGLFVLQCVEPVVLSNDVVDKNSRRKTVSFDLVRSEARTREDPKPLLGRRHPPLTKRTQPKEVLFGLPTLVSLEDLGVTQLRVFTHSSTFRGSRHCKMVEGVSGSLRPGLVGRTPSPRFCYLTLRPFNTRHGSTRPIKSCKRTSVRTNGHAKASPWANRQLS